MAPPIKRPRRGIDQHGIKSFFQSATATSYTVKMPDKSTIGDFVEDNFLSVDSLVSSPPCKFKNFGAKKKESSRMTQLKIDISNRPTTQTCKDCGMSYVIGVEEDRELHDRHHRQVVGGLEWPLEVDYDARQVVWRGSSGLDEDRIIKLSLDIQNLKKTKYRNRVDQLLQMVNCCLGAQELSAEQLQRSNIYIYLTESSPSALSSKKHKMNCSNSKTQRRKPVVAAVCIAGRVDFAYQIADRTSSNNGARGSGNASNAAGGDDEHDESLFEIVDSGVFCLRDPQKVLIGIHRIWTSPNYRRSGFARRLLDSVSKTFVYGLPLLDDEIRRRLISFSQPTESGVKLAIGWLKNPTFKVYIE
ncbi:ESCO1/2 acetyl-transferase-domain-containing protein [Phakopsora pachyrhizi]|uniref:ESCO1/2 acetyl-transferase-domain-containing protein n=1 Tax=Phakopsora pachyrhizi TaxID=170000 RepID=A0AAV0BLZ8_PHAPC|nr:ESCO1/2 acetyl-transferase-domain-containing protein [Phakopsora pachyrhizi]CAH7687127.1 ESCO1/2 acetyl-transferase-domain-containing protein [Phakopsora pachyrhizi]